MPGLPSKSAMGSSLLDGYLTVLECCRELGINRRTLERWQALDEGPPKTRIGGRVYYRRDSVVAWLRDW